MAKIPKEEYKPIAKQRRVLVNVKPLRTTEEIDDFKWAIKYTGKERDLVLFLIGINMGLRISDIVKLKVKQVRGVYDLNIIEQKTQKAKSLRIPKDLRDVLEVYTKRMQEDDYLFPSQKPSKVNGETVYTHITTTQAYRILQKAADVLERNDIGTHTMRKTFGYMHYKRFKDVAKLQHIFNHSHPRVTLAYIGITDDEIADTMEDFSL